MNNRKTFLLYGSMALLSVVLFLYLLFPGDKIVHHLRFAFHQMLPEYSLDIAASRASFPAALTLSDVTISKMNDPVFDATAVKIGPSLLSLFSSDSTYSIKAAAYGGDVKGKLTTTKNESALEFATELKFTGIQIGETAMADQLFNGDVSGILSGRITYDNNQPGQKGDINLVLTDVTIPINMSFFNLGNIHFTDIAIEGVLNQQDLTIKKCEAKGNQASAQVSGVIVVKNPIDSSLLSVSGTLEPHQELLKNIPLNMFPTDKMGSKGLPFFISGTISNPVVELR